MFKVTTALLLPSLAALGWQQRSERRSLPQARLHGEALHIEYDATSGEAVLKAEADSDEELVRCEVRGPDGELVLELGTRGQRPGEQKMQAKRGGRKPVLTGFCAELSELGLVPFLETHPEGTYEFRAWTADDRVVVGRAELSQ